MKTIVHSNADFLCNIPAPCFQQLKPIELELIKSSRTQLLFRKGDNLTKQGAFSSYVLFVTEGLAKQYLESDGYKNLNLRITRPGEFVGLSAIFLDNVFKYSTIAISECTAFLIEKEAIIKVIRNNGNFGIDIIKKYCEQNTTLFEKLHTFQNKQMNGRIAEVLLYMNELKKEHTEIFQLLSRKDIAEFAGITTESAVKILKSFEKENIILLHDKDIVILEEKQLELISQKG